MTNPNHVHENANEQEIRRIIETWAEAVRKKELDKILAFHTSDFIMFDVPPPFQSVGIEAYRETWNTFYKYTRLGVFNFHNLKIVAGEDVAFCIATMWCDDNADGKGYKHLDFRLTVGLKKIDGQWMIVHEHHSIPAE